MSEADQTYLQADQPEGVPPLELTGERTLPDVPEENYWYRRHVAVYEWIAERCAGLRVVDLACGEGYGSDLLAGRAAEVTGVDANPEAFEHARARYRRPNLGFQRGLVEDFDRRSTPWSSSRRSSTSTSPSKLARADRADAPVAYISTPNRLTLAPPGAEKSDNPWHLREYDAGQYRELLEPHFPSVELLGLFHARKLRAHELAIRAGWDRVHPALHITKPFYDRFIPAISARDFRCGPATSTGRSTSSRSAALMMPERSAGDLAIVLHSHMPYVEGFGTYPFGEEWLFDAFARSHLPVLDVAERLTMTVTPVLADQLEADGRGGEDAPFLRRHRVDAADRDVADAGAAVRPAAKAEADHYTRAMRRLRKLGGRSAARLPGGPRARAGSR